MTSEFTQDFIRNPAGLKDNPALVFERGFSPRLVIFPAVRLEMAGCGKSRLFRSCDHSGGVRPNGAFAVGGNSHSFGDCAERLCETRADHRIHAL